MKIRNQKKQQGATLMVALILLTVLTLLGVSSIKTSTNSLKLASNDRAAFNNFQAAFSAIDQAMIDLGTNAVGTPSTTYTYKVGTKTDGSGDDVNVAVTARLTARTTVQGVPGEAIGAQFTKRELIVIATSGGTSTSVQIQGILVPIPNLD